MVRAKKKEILRKKPEVVPGIRTTTTTKLNKENIDLENGWIKYVLLETHKKRIFILIYYYDFFNFNSKRQPQKLVHAGLENLPYVI